MKICEVCGSDKEVFLNKTTNKYLCGRHRVQVYKYGKTIRTASDPNEIIEYDNHAEVILYNIKKEEVSHTTIDKYDIEKVKRHKWRLSNGRVETTVNRRTVSLSRYIIDAQDDDIIDHINGNPLDNRRQNLRPCTYQDNNRNRRKTNNSVSGMAGVHYSKDSNMWVVRIRNEESRQIHLGSYEDLEYAKVIRLKAEEIVFKDFSPNNHLFFILSKYEDLKNIKTLNELRCYLNIGYKQGHVLDKNKVKEIKELLIKGDITQKQIAQIYNVSEFTISSIKLGKVWAWVKNDTL